MKVSFTGTREGMSTLQWIAVRALLLRKRELITLAAHGNCKGSDAEFHKLVREICGKSVYIAVFPSTCNATRMPDPEDADYIAPPKGPVDRDRDIVRIGHDALIATPLASEGRRSGTWTTVRFARKRRVKRYIVLRDGTLVEEEP